MTNGSDATQEMPVPKFDTIPSSPPDDPDSLPEGLARISHVGFENDEMAHPRTLEEQVQILTHTSTAVANEISRINAIVSDVQERVAEIGKRAERRDEAVARQNNALTVLLARSTRVRSEELERKIVLVAEDDELLLPLMRSMLADAGATVYCERDALHARLTLEKIGPENLACAVLDVKLTDSEGLGLARDFRKRAPGCGVVLTSGWGLQEYAFDADAHQYVLLNKPFDPRELIDCVLVAMLQRSSP